MKAKIFAYVTLFTVIAAVLLNTFFLEREIGSMIDRVNAIDIDGQGAYIISNEIRRDFMKLESFISLTVSHDDLTNIEDNLAELCGCIDVGDITDAYVVKSRLINSLEHLRRLSGINFDSII